MWRPLIVAGTVLFIWMAVFSHRGLYKWEHLRQVRARLLEEKEGLLKKKEMIKEQEEKLTSPAYLEHRIREELGYIKDGEKLIRFIPRQDRK